MFLLRSVTVKQYQPQIVKVMRDDGIQDCLTRRSYSTYDEAYDTLERFYGDLCCSDERIEYSIVTTESPS